MILQELKPHGFEFTAEQQQAFLAGDPEAIVGLANVYRHVNGLPAIPQDKIDDFMGGGWAPGYLHQADDPVRWGMAEEDAERCAVDIERTSLLIQGIVKAVPTLKQTFPGEDLTGVEPGCGTALLSVAMIWAGMDQVIAPEINPQTAQYAAKFIEALSLQDQIHIVEADATQIDIGLPVHLIVPEQLATPAIKEPQFHIIRHLLKFLAPGGIVLPKGITISFRLAHADWDGIQAQIGDKADTELAPVAHLVSILDETQGVLPRMDFLETRHIAHDPDTQPITGHIGWHSLSESRSVNALIGSMAVHVDDELTLHPNQGKFLGTDQIMKIEPVLLTPGHVGFVHYLPGGEPPHQIHLFEAE